MGLRLYRTFIDGGLDAPELRQDAPIGGGVDWPGYALIAESVRSLLPFMEQIGTVTAEEADVDTLEARLRNEALAHDAVQVLPTVIGAWTRKRELKSSGITARGAHQQPVRARRIRVGSVGHGEHGPSGIGDPLKRDITRRAR